MFSDGWYTVRLIRSNVWAIDDAGQDNFYAVIGETSAVMIDNGWGAGRLDELTARLSDKPWFTINTHGDIDHALGNSFFNEAYIGKPDMCMLSNEEIEMKRSVILSDNEVDKNRKPDFKTPGGSMAKKKTLPLSDGMTFDLGGRVITAYLIPGHTMGSACFIDNKSRILFMGDMLVPLQEWNEMWMHMERCTGLQVMLNSINRVRGMRAQFDTIASGHGNNYSLEPDLLDETAQGLESIIAGRIVGEPVNTAVGPGLSAHFGRCGVIYDPKRIR